MKKGESGIKATSKIGGQNIGESKLKKVIEQKDFLKLQDEIREIKYPVKPISSGEQFKKKIQTFSQTEVKDQLKTIGRDFNTYRQVRGDGNCFFRAISFEIISSLSSFNVSQCFEYLDDVNLTVCKEQTIPKQFRPFYDDRFLKTLLKENWSSGYKQFLRKYNSNYRMSLASHLNANPFLDFIVILYFRSICLKALGRYHDQFKDFLQGTEEELIKTYGEESEGVVLNLCSQFLKIKISVFEIRAKQVLKYQYTTKRDSKYQVALLFYEHHYDIIQHNTKSQLDLQKQERKGQVDVQFFEEVSLTTTHGHCCLCNQQSQIYQENALCLKCYEASRQTLDTYKKDKLIRARCNQCDCISSNVSEQLGLCQHCIRTQKLYADRKYDCLNCKVPIENPGKCLKCDEFQKIYMKKNYKYARCINCNVPDEVSIDLGICNFCAKQQSKQIQRNKIQNEKNKKCSKCNQQCVILNDQQVCKDCQNNKAIKKQLNKQPTSSELTCKQCKNMKSELKQLSNGICMDCSEKQSKAYQYCKNCQKTSNSGIKFYDNLCEKCWKVKEKKCYKCQRQFKEQVPDGVCKQCKDLIKKLPSSGLKTKCQVCSRCKITKKEQQIKKGICNDCWKKNQPQQETKEIVKCKTCPRNSKYHSFQNGYCPACRISELRKHN